MPLRILSMLLMVALVLVAVYAQSLTCVYSNANALNTNYVAAFVQNPDGTLSSAGHYPTPGAAGSGTNKDPHTQGALALNPSGTMLFVANSDNATVSAGQYSSFTQFAVNPSTCQLTLVHTHNYPFAREQVLTLSASHNQVLVATDSSMTLYTYFGSNLAVGSWVRYPKRDVSQVHLVGETGVIMTERSGNTLSSFGIVGGQLSSNNMTIHSQVPAPFGFSLLPPSGRTPLLALVAEVNPGGPSKSHLSTYQVSLGHSGSAPLLRSVQSIALHQEAACWTALYPQSSNAFAFTANAGSNTVSMIEIDRATGQVSFISGDVATVSTPFDMVVSPGPVLHVLATGSHSIESFAIDIIGKTLTPLGMGVPVANSTVGLVSTMH